MREGRPEGGFVCILVSSNGFKGVLEKQIESPWHLIGIHIVIFNWNTLLNLTHR